MPCHQDTTDDERCFHTKRAASKSRPIKKTDAAGIRYPKHTAAQKIRPLRWPPAEGSFDSDSGEDFNDPVRSAKTNLKWDRIRRAYGQPTLHDDLDSEDSEDDYMQVPAVAKGVKVYTQAEARRLGDQCLKGGLLDEEAEKKKEKENSDSSKKKAELNARTAKPATELNARMQSLPAPKKSPKSVGVVAFPLNSRVASRTGDKRVILKRPHPDRAEPVRAKRPQPERRSDAADLPPRYNCIEKKWRLEGQ